MYDPNAEYALTVSKLLVGGIQERGPASLDGMESP